MRDNPEDFNDILFKIMRFGEHSPNYGFTPWINIQKLLGIIDHMQSRIELLRWPSG